MAGFLRLAPMGGGGLWAEEQREMELASRDYKAMGRSRFEISGCRYGCGFVGCEHALASCLESGGDGSGTCVIHESKYNEMRMRKRRVTQHSDALQRVQPEHEHASSAQET